MTTKERLERVLQILEDVERVGTISDIERDIVLGELREAYLELRFATKVECAEPKADVVAPVQPIAEEPTEEPVEGSVEDDETECDEPEVEFEIIFNEDDDEDEGSEAEEPTVEQEPIAEPEPSAEPEVEPTPEPVDEPDAVEEVVEENLSTLNSQLSTEEDEFQIIPPKSQGRSAILSLYDDEPQRVLGEQFASEQPSVADTIAPLKGVAESAPLESLRSAIGVADRFMLIRELFDGDAECYNAAIDALDAQPSFDDCLIYIAEHYSWRADREGTKFMMELLQRKFN